jgi:predicted secreted protein
MAVTPGIINGNKVLVYIDGVAIGCTTGGTLTITNEQIETTCKDNDGAKTYLAGSQDWNIQVSGNTKFDAPVGLNALGEAAKTAATVTVRMATGNADDPYYEGDAFISSFTWDNATNAVSTYSATFSPRSAIAMFNC